MAKKDKAAPAAEAPAAATATATAEAPKAAEVPKQPQQNGITRPKSGTATGKVWEISDDLSSKASAPAPRKDVMDAGLALGLNAATIATQYGKWRKFHGLGRTAAVKTNGDAPETATEGGPDDDE